MNAAILVLMGRLQYGLACILSGFTRLLQGRREDLRYFSSLFREPKLFAVLPDYLRQRFPDGAPVYCYAASNGAEPYSLAMKLIDAWGAEAARRFFPIRARERNPEMVALAKAEGTLVVDEEDLRCYRQAGMKSRLARFLKRDRTRKTLGRYHVAPELQPTVVFEVADFAEDLKHPFEQPCLILFRNAWYHFRETATVDLLCENLYRNLPSGSSLIVGDIWLEKNGYGGLLEARGFRRVGTTGPLSQIFERP